MTPALGAAAGATPDADSIRGACVLRDVARAKVNLTLEIRGRRPDGYHELESLVAFTEFGDELVLDRGRPDLSLEVGGPFGDAIEGGNLIQKAAELLGAERVVHGAFFLEKRIPVAAGLGGGSADAAAALRLLAGLPSSQSAPEGNEAHGRENQASGDFAALAEVATRIGADVPVCLFSRPALMMGIGERLRFVPAFPSVPVVLVNPRLPLATAAVFRELRAAPVEAAPAEAPPSELASIDAVLHYARSRGNDLEAPARRLLPVIGIMFDALAACPGALLARLSGSGPTCFGLFRTDADAEQAAARIAAAHPGWWVRATRLG